MNFRECILHGSWATEILIVSRWNSPPVVSSLSARESHSEKLISFIKGRAAAILMCAALACARLFLASSAPPAVKTGVSLIIIKSEL